MRAGVGLIMRRWKHQAQPTECMQGNEAYEKFIWKAGSYNAMGRKRVENVFVRIPDVRNYHVRMKLS